MDKEYDIDEIVSSIDFNSGSFQNINGMMLTNREIEVLNKYKIPYQKCNNLKEIIFEINCIQYEISINYMDSRSYNYWHTNNIC